MNKKDIEAIYPLSPSQQGLLCETLSAPSSGLHIEQTTITLKGNLHLAFFKRAWQRVVERHSIFRTGFIWKKQDRPLQFVQKSAVIPFEFFCWRNLHSTQQQEKLQLFLNENRCRSFNLAKPSLMRLAVFQIEDDVYQLVWTQHHILTDGWCLPLILKEVMAFYEAFSVGKDLSLTASRPYRDYITWLKRQDMLQAQLYWQKTLQGFTKPTPLGVTTQASNLLDKYERYGKEQAYLSTSATTTLQTLVKQNRLSLNNLIQGLWALLLSRYSGDSDVVFGTTVSGRPPTLEGVESMIGLFINTLPMRVKVDTNELLWSWLKNIQIEQIEQRDYEYCSTGQIHQWSQVPGSLPLYESILVFENYPDDLSTLQLSSLSVDMQNTFSKGAQTKYALTIMVIPGSQMEFEFVYDRHRLDDSSVKLIKEHFITLLNSIVALPDRDIVQLKEQIPANQIPQFSPLQRRVQEHLKDSFALPRDTLELQIAEIWEEVLDVRPVGIKDNFFDLGGHSLLAIRLMSKIQQNLGKDLPLATLFAGSTVEELASIIRSSTDSLEWSPLVAIQPHGDKRPFFFMPGGGGNVIYLYHLARKLPTDQPFYGLQARGLDGEQAPDTEIEAIAAYNIEAIKTIQPQGPYLFGGHSFGSYVAFEMALQLQRQGEEVDLLALIDSPAPNSDLKGIKHDVDDATYLVGLASNIERFSGCNLSVSYEDLKQLQPEDQLNYLLERLQKVNIFPAEAKLKQLRGFLQVFKANDPTQYFPQSIYPQQITVFRALDNNEFGDELDIGWQKFSSTPVETHFVPGDHISIMTEPHVKSLAQQLKACLEGVLTRETRST